MLNAKNENRRKGILDLYISNVGVLVLIGHFIFLISIVKQALVKVSMASSNAIK